MITGLCDHNLPASSVTVQSDGPIWHDVTVGLMVRADAFSWCCGSPEPIKVNISIEKVYENHHVNTGFVQKRSRVAGGRKDVALSAA